MQICLDDKIIIFKLERCKRLKFDPTSNQMPSRVKPSYILLVLAHKNAVNKIFPCM